MTTAATPPFISHEGLSRCTRMPFGLYNAPGTFQRVTDILLTGVKWQFTLVHLDDIIVYSSTVSDHYDHLRDVLHILQRTDLTLRLTKCYFPTNRSLSSGTLSSRAGSPLPLEPTKQSNEPFHYACERKYALS